MEFLHDDIIIYLDLDYYDLVHLHRTSKSWMNVLEARDLLRLFCQKFSIENATNFNDFCMKYSTKYITRHSPKFLGLEESFRRSCETNELTAYFHQCGAKNFEQLAAYSVSIGSNRGFKYGCKYIHDMSDSFQESLLILAVKYKQHTNFKYVGYGMHDCDILLETAIINNNVDHFLQFHKAATDPDYLLLKIILYNRREMFEAMISHPFLHFDSLFFEHSPPEWLESHDTLEIIISAKGGLNNLLRSCVQFKRLDILDIMHKKDYLEEKHIYWCYFHGYASSSEDICMWCLDCGCDLYALTLVNPSITKEGIEHILISEKHMIPPDRKKFTTAIEYIVNSISPDQGTADQVLEFMVPILEKQMCMNVEDAHLALAYLNADEYERCFEYANKGTTNYGYLIFLALIRKKFAAAKYLIEHIISV